MQSNVLGRNPTTGMPDPVLTDGAGRLQTSSAGGGIAQGAALGTNTGGLNMASVATNAPAYTNGTIQPKSLNTEGYMRVVTPDLASPTFWNYAAAAGGIVSSIADVAIKAAAGAGVRNFIKSLQISTDVLGAATEIVVKDGAATVLWRQKLQAAVLPVTTINFDPPLKGTANTALNVALITSVTGGVFVGAQGYTGT